MIRIATKPVGNDSLPAQYTVVIFDIYDIINAAWMGYIKDLLKIRKGFSSVTHG